VKLRIDFEQPTKADRAPNQISRETPIFAAQAGFDGCSEVTGRFARVAEAT
jgi:hypothetical protein